MFIPPLSIEITATFLSEAVVVPTKAIVKSCKAKGLQSIRNKRVYSEHSVCLFREFVLFILVD